MNVAVLSATTRRMPCARAASNTFAFPRVDRLEVGHVLARAAEQRRAMDRRIAPFAAARTSSAFADVALDHLDADRRERRRIVGVAHQRAHCVAPRSAARRHWRR